MSFIRADKRTTITTLSLAAALLAPAACTSRETSQPDEPPDRGNQFPRTLAAGATGDKTSITPKNETGELAGESLTRAMDHAREPAPRDVEPRVPESYDQLMSDGEELMSRDPKEALVHFERALELEHDRALPHIQAARALIAMNELFGARTHAETAVEMNPRSSFAWNTLGRVELAEGNREAAKTSFERATDENEGNSYAWNNLGYVYIMEEHWEQAAAALENATNGAKTAAYMWNNLGVAYEHLAELNRARAAYREAAERGSEKAAKSLVRLEGVPETAIGGLASEASEIEGVEAFEKTSE